MPVLTRVSLDRHGTSVDRNGGGLANLDLERQTLDTWRQVRRWP